VVSIYAPPHSEVWCGLELGIMWRAHSYNATPWSEFWAPMLYHQSMRLSQCGGVNGINMLPLDTSILQDFFGLWWPGFICSDDVGEYLTQYLNSFVSGKDIDKWAQAQTCILLLDCFKVRLETDQIWCTHIPANGDKFQEVLASLGKPSFVAPCPAACPMHHQHVVLVRERL